MKNSIILLGFNELCPALMAEFSGAGRLPHFNLPNAAKTAEMAGEPLCKLIPKREQT